MWPIARSGSTRYDTTGRACGGHVLPVHTTHNGGTHRDWPRIIVYSLGRAAAAVGAPRRRRAEPRRPAAACCCLPLAINAAQRARARSDRLNAASASPHSCDAPPPASRDASEPDALVAAAAATAAALRRLCSRLRRHQQPSAPQHTVSTEAPSERQVEVCVQQRCIPMGCGLAPGCE